MINSLEIFSVPRQKAEKNIRQIVRESAPREV